MRARKFFITYQIRSLKLKSKMLTKLEVNFLFRLLHLLSKWRMAPLKETKGMFYTVVPKWFIPQSGVVICSQMSNIIFCYWRMLGSSIETWILLSLSLVILLASFLFRLTLLSSRAELANLANNLIIVGSNSGKFFCQCSNLYCIIVLSN